MKRIYAREEICMACRLCEVHCAVQHSQTKNPVKAFKREATRPVPRCSVEVKGALSFSFMCRHCAEPTCMYSCISGAMHREPNGTIRVDESKCIGCWTCILACQYGSIKRQEQGDKHFALKCDLCPGLEVPACVANCPNDALVLTEEDDPVMPQEVNQAR
ncbi:MAG TPA: 4Fe-4S dicluster domain-containing protein [Symbiobacteriaceae bacterium]